MDQLDSVRRRRSLTRETGDDRLALARRRLLRQASVFEDPAAYAAGVEDAFAAIAELGLVDDRRAPGDQQPPRPTPRVAGGVQ